MLGLNIGFTTESINAAEGESILACAMILNGTLGSGLVLDYFINAPRENPDLPAGIEADSATRMFNGSNFCVGDTV